ncbi:MAG: hypothetical protein MJ179_07915 [Treponema sp.]|nr:hypothetical protein [Treponema sp.]
MILDLSEEELKIIRQGLFELPIKTALNTLSSLDEKIVNAQQQNITMATPEPKGE